jgi:flagellar hook-associated protein 3 FlgL
MQTELARLGREITTGRLADVGLVLGAETGHSMKLHIDTRYLSGLISANGTALARLQATESALARIAGDSDRFLTALIDAKSTGSNVLLQLAPSALSGFIDTINTQDGHDYLLAGINSASRPLAGFAAGPRSAIETAFLNRFGLMPDDPGAAAIAAADIADFLDNEFAALFDDPDWAATWSSASSEAITARIARGETVVTSVSANEPAIRKLAMVYSMVVALMPDKLGGEARQAVLDKAIALVGEAGAELTAIRAGLGTTRNRVEVATERLRIENDILATRIMALEGVDPAEAKVRIDTLSTEIEMSYALTARLLRLSIINYA